MPRPAFVSRLSMLIAGGVCAWTTAACVNNLPMQDRRILEAVPVAKLSVEALAGDYRRDAAGANRQYWGKALEVSGEIAGTRDEAVAPSLLFNDKDGRLIVQAFLLDDQAKAILAATADSRRVTLTCFCDGLHEHVVLKSCVAR